MTLKVTALENVGVEVSGFDITRPPDKALAAELVDLWNEHAILLFRGQAVNPENQIAFSRVFGELAMHPLAATTSQEYPELFMLVNEPEKEKFMTARYNAARTWWESWTGTWIYTTRVSPIEGLCCVVSCVPVKMA